MRKALEGLILIFGLVCMAIACVHIAIGPSAIPGSVPVNATMDSEDRFYATLFGAFGVALLWCVKDVEQKSRVVYFLLATFFVAGLARVVSIAAVGLPDPFFVAMLALELVIPIVVAFMQHRVVSR
jgi:hypothetical protein